MVDTVQRVVPRQQGLTAVRHAADPGPVRFDPPAGADPDEVRQSRREAAPPERPRIGQRTVPHAVHEVGAGLGAPSDDARIGRSLGEVRKSVAPDINCALAVGFVI